QAPVHVADLWTIRDKRCGAAPELPIQRRRWSLRSRVLGAGGVMNVSFRANDSACVSGLNVGPHGLKGCALTLLNPSLHKALTLGDRPNHGAAFPPIITQRLFTIDIDSMVQGSQKLECVPMRGCRNDHGIELTRLKKLIVQFECSRTRSLQFLK